MKREVNAFDYAGDICKAMSKGIRMKDMPDEWFWIPTDDEMKNVMQAAQGFIYCGRLLDAQKWDAFKTLADHILSMESGLMGIQRIPWPATGSPANCSPRAAGKWWRTC